MLLPFAIPVAHASVIGMSQQLNLTCFHGHLEWGMIGNHERGAVTIGTRRTYSDEFKQEAIKLATEHGLTRKQVARDLGIDPQTLRS